MGSAEQIETIIESNGAPLVRETGDRQQPFDAAADRVAVGALTDRRFVVDPGTDSASDDTPISIPYQEVTAVRLDDLRSPTEFAVTVQQGSTWRLGVAPSATGAAKYGRRLVEKALDLFEQIEAATDAVNSARSDLVEPIAENDDWATTSERYDRMRSAVDRATVGVENSPFDGSEPFCEPLARADDRLEAANVAATLCRVEKVCAVGREWFADGDVERGSRAVETARESLAVVASQAETHDFDVGDAAGDGTAVNLESLSSPIADAETLEAAIDRADQQVDSVAQQPLQDADELRRGETSVEALEAAFDRYRTLLEAVWSEEETFGITRESLQERVETTAAALIETRTDIASQALDRGDRALAADRVLEAGDAYRTAARHYERAHELAKVYRAGDPAPISDAIETLRETRRTLPLRPTLREQ